MVILLLRPLDVLSLNRPVAYLGATGHLLHPLPPEVPGSPTSIAEVSPGVSNATGMDTWPVTAASSGLLWPQSRRSCPIEKRKTEKGAGSATLHTNWCCWQEMAGSIGYRRHTLPPQFSYLATSLPQAASPTGDDHWTFFGVYHWTPHQDCG